ncbi:MAG: hypothetical protein RSC43_00840 [Clostridia bacterium]
MKNIALLMSLICAVAALSACKKPYDEPLFPSTAPTTAATSAASAVTEESSSVPASESAESSSKVQVQTLPASLPDDLKSGSTAIPTEIPSTSVSLLDESKSASESASKSEASTKESGLSQDDKDQYVQMAATELMTRQELKGCKAKLMDVQKGEHDNEWVVVFSVDKNSKTYKAYVNVNSELLTAVYDRLE